MTSADTMIESRALSLSERMRDDVSIDPKMNVMMAATIK